jgi:hypothetical protein
MDEKNKKLKFVRVPKFEEVPYPIVNGTKLSN